MIFDTFLYYDEADLLELRLRTLDEVVDRFVLVEGEIDNNGAPKPSYYSEQAERFAPWADKITHIWATDLPPAGWDVEYAKREWIREGIKDAAPDDLIILSDVDEIPNPDVLRDLRPEGFVRFVHRLYCFAVDWLHPRPWVGTIAAPFKALGDSIQQMRELRHLNYAHLPYVEDNWHFTWIGGTEQNWRKLASSHDPENQSPEIIAGLSDGNRFLRDGVYIGGIDLIPVEVDETWPRWIYERRCPPQWFRGNYQEAAT